MKTRDAARKGAYIGAGAGLVLFALFGLLPGSLIGGAAGINIAGWLFGLPLEPGLISRVIVLASMLVGVLVAGIVIVTATSTVGWLAGKLMETGAAAKEAGDEDRSDGGRAGVPGIRDHARVLLRELRDPDHPAEAHGRTGRAHALRAGGGGHGHPGRDRLRSHGEHRGRRPLGHGCRRGRLHPRGPAGAERSCREGVAGTKDERRRNTAV